jgi:HTH-type transcriptional regulator / antitoxin HigA
VTDALQTEWVSPPGDTIADLIERKGWSEIEFTRHMGCTQRAARELLSGRLEISLETAIKLATILGGSPKFWASRERQYRASLDLQHKAWLKELPLRDMRRHGWIAPSRSKPGSVAACLEFFGVNQLQEWRTKYRDVLKLAAFRTTPAFASRSAPVAAWLRRCEIEAEKIRCKPWNANVFAQTLAKVRRLTRERHPDVFLRELTAECATSGVAVVIVRAPEGCRASGATRFVSPTKALLMLTFRHLSDDHFWFTFFHEAAHLLLHSHTTLFLEGSKVGGQEEDEANRFAANILVPSEFKDRLMTLRIDRHEIRTLAKTVGVSPGIVLGQLQHMGRARRDQLNMLKVYFKWNDGK